MVQLELYVNNNYEPNEELNYLTDVFKYVFKEYNKFRNGRTDYIPAGKIQFKNNEQQRRMFNKIFYMNFEMLKSKTKLTSNYQKNKSI